MKLSQKTHESLLTMASYAGYYRSANEMPITRAARDIVRQQPGYRRGAKMALRYTRAGGVRLWVLAGGNIMDASLSDIV
jgi:hypothetical protein